ncbi:MAG: ABC transporter substrate-binding protein [Deltaproteobacteria bacterium]|nr:ABC transporter substrate-binding protein [Deltaproteobacteria bacterium]
MKKHSVLTYAVVALGFLFLGGCKSSNSNSLFVYTSLEEVTAKALIKAFEEETKIKTEFVRLSTGEAGARIEAEKNNPQGSIWVGGPAGSHAEARDKGLTIPYHSPATSTLNAKYKDKENYWSGLYLGILAFVANTDQLKKLGLTAPETWADLTDPKWKNHIQIPNPGTSGTSYNVMTTLITKFGEQDAFNYMKNLHKNISQYTRSGAAPIKNAALGESAVAVGYTQDIFRLIYESKAPLQLIYPKDGTGYEVAAVSLIKGGKQTELAQKLYDWLYSPAASQILADNFNAPLVKTKETQVKPEVLLPVTLKLIDTDVDWAGKNRQRLIDLWNDRING